MKKVNALVHDVIHSNKAFDSLVKKLTTLRLFFIENKDKTKTEIG